MANNTEPNLYPEDGTPQVAPDEEAWLNASEEQIAQNRAGLAAARATIGATASVEDVVSTVRQSSDHKPLALGEDVLPDAVQRVLTSETPEGVAARAARRETKRAARRAPQSPLPGRKREESAQQVLTPELTDKDFDELARIVRRSTVPVRDKLTHKYNFFPNPKSAGMYVERGVNKALKHKTAKTSEEIVDLEQRRQRAKWQIVDETQQTTWVNQSVAAERYHYLATAKKNLESDQELDVQTAQWVSDSVRDFGFCLKEDIGTAKRLGFDTELGEAIIKLADEMLKNPTIITRYSTLIDTVMFEQTKRYKFWNERFEALTKKFGNKLKAEERSQQDRPELKTILETVR